MHGARGEAAMEGLADLAPDLARLVAEHAFSDLYARPGLDLKARQFALSRPRSPWATASQMHMNAAMRLGWTQAELVELILQMSAYAGFPAAMKAVTACSLR
jgi:4-carboxymuconolactone decarboxylase